MLQVRADLVETAQRTLEGEEKRASQEESIRQLVLHKTQELQVVHSSKITNACQHT